MTWPATIIFPLGLTWSALAVDGDEPTLTIEARIVNVKTADLVAASHLEVDVCAAGGLEVAARG